MRFSDGVLAGLDTASWITGLIVVALVYYAGRAVYRVYLHPLSKFPGPRIRAISHLPQAYHISRGFEFKEVKKLHDEYGSVVRIAPNELSYNNAGAFRDVYGFVQGRKQIPKLGIYYNTFGETTKQIFDAGDEDHARMRRLLAHAFSAQALHEQEPLMNIYFDLLIRKLREQINTHGTAKLNIVAFYNSTTFDLIGDLSFGEAFGALENGGHPWIDNIFRHVRELSIVMAATSYPFIFQPFLLAVKHIPAFAQAKKNHDDFTRSRMTKRLRDPPDVPRKDFTDFILQHSDEEKRAMTEPEMVRNSEAFIIAGSETSATLLSGATYLLLKHPACLAKLLQEIQAAVSSPEEINVKSTQNMPYLTAVLEEAMRMYPPFACTLYRLTASDTRIDGQVVPAGTKLGVSHFSTYRSARNFRDPDSFVPERWLGAPEYEGDDREAFHPFSLGPRNCIGRNLAYAEMRCILARVFYHFDFSLCDESQNWLDHANFVLWEKPPLMVGIQERRFEA